MNSIKYILISIVALYSLIGLIIYFFQERFIFLPTLLPDDYKYQFETPVEEHLLNVDDGVLNLLHFHAKDSLGLIVYFHGNAGSLERWGKVVEPFVELGYDVLIADYRGYGKSKGRRSQQTLLSDAENIYSFALTLEEEKQIILYGRSLGTGFASYLSGKHTPGKVILETPFYSLEAEARERVKLYPVSWLLQYRLKSHQYLQQNKAPVFVFHGTEDRVVPYKSGIRLFENIDANEGQFITIEGGFHHNLSEYPEYWKALKSILHE